MKRIHQSQIRELLLQLTDLRNRLDAIFQDAGEGMSAYEEITIKKTLARLKAAIGDLTGVI